MDQITQTVLKMDLENLSFEQIKYLHDLKAEAISGWAKRELQSLKGAN